MRNPELWARLCAFEFDRGTGTAPFSVKLSRAEGWSPGFTARVIEEYRRFIYLTQVSTRQATPSQIVDAAWHMHLTFTRDYWEELCLATVGKPIHHQPCAGDEEMPRYRDQFSATKALYEAEFGHEPPADIWARDKVAGLRGFALEEEGSVTGSDIFITFLPFVISLVLYAYERDPLVGIIAIVTGVMFVATLLNRRRRSRKRRKRADRDDVDWIEDDSGSGSGGGGRSVPSKQGRDDDTSRNSNGGFWAMFGGDGDNDGGGGCGGCGGD